MDTNVLTAVRFALDVALKATLVFACTGLVLLALRRGAASARHVVAALGLAAALAIPALSLLLPRFELPLVPSPVPAAAERPELPKAESVESAPTWRATFRQVSDDGRSNGPAAPAGEVARPSSEGPAVPAASEPVVSGERLLFACLFLWGAGAFFFLARLGVGVARVSLYRGRARPVASPAWTALADHLAVSLGIRRPVPLLASEEVPVAVTSGVVRPVLLLPAGARAWEPGRRRVVLLHELAHVRRGDWLALLVSEVAVAVYWLHPLVWLLARRLRQDGERAADDLVLSVGTKPSVYAGHLLGIIRSFQPTAGRLLHAMGIARPSQFEERLRAILDPCLRRRGFSIVQIRAVAAALFALAVLISAVEPWTAGSAEAAIAADPAGIPADLFVSHPSSSGIQSATAEESECARPKQEPKARPGVSAPAHFVPAIRTAAPGTDPDGREGAGGGDEVLPQSAGGFVKASNGKSRDGNDWYSRGMELHGQERYDEAIRAFAKAIEHGYREDAAMYNIACGFARKGDADRAFEWLEKAVEAGFDAVSYLQRDDDLESLRSDPRLAELRKKAREQEIASRQDEAARAAARFERLAAKAQPPAEALYEVGKELLKVGRYDLSARAFQLSAQAGHRTGASLYNTACALSLAGDRAAALDFLQKSLEAGFDDPKLVRKDGDLDAIRGEPRYRELVEMADALALRPDGDAGWKRRAGGEDLHRASWARAARRFAAYAKQNTGLGRAWFNLGYASLSGGDAEGAVRAFERALSLGYREPTTMYNLACSHSRMERTDEAFDWLFKALDAGFEGEGMLRSDEDLDHLRGDPRFRKALAIAKAQHRRED